MMLKCSYLLHYSIPLVSISCYILVFIFFCPHLPAQLSVSFLCCNNNIIAKLLLIALLLEYTVIIC